MPAWYAVPQPVIEIFVIARSTISSIFELGAELHVVVFVDAARPASP